jgi:2-keto-4-pentenoate hydratase/2-oxohepta-3-ene-1,7-dioic acid hydratase in catechol pathway
MVTADEIADPQRLAIRSTLNGQLMQDSHTGEMIFSVAELIAFCSQAFTLEPGDVLLTGTPHGVGLGREPQLYMQDGDVVVVEIEGIGRLENRCRVV